MDWIWIAVTLVCTLAAGLVVAGFGALKDTLWEDFSWLKFFRTPILITICAGFLMLFLWKHTAPYGFLNVVIYVGAAAAAERILTDTYKAIRRQKPSKFNRPQRDTRWLRERLAQLWQRTHHKAS